MESDYKSFVGQIVGNNQNGMTLLNPGLLDTRQSIHAQSKIIRNDSYDNQQRLMPLQTLNISNTYNDYLDNVTNVKKEPGKRDPQAGVQYFTPYVGVNPKTMIQPVIGPRITDKDYWGKQSTVVSDTNRLNIVDVTNEAININDMAQMSRIYPQSQPDGVGQVSFPLAVPVKYENRAGNGVWDMNPVGQDPDIGYYPSQSNNYYNNDNVLDYDRNILSTFQNPNVYPLYNVEDMLSKQPLPGINTNSTPLYAPYQLPYSQPYAIQNVGITQDMAMQQMGVPPQQQSKEGFAFLERFEEEKKDNQTNIPNIPNIPPNNVMNPNINNSLGSIPPNQLYYNYYAQPPQYPLMDKFNNNGNRGIMGGKYTMLDRVPPGQNVQIPNVPDQLMYQSPVYAFTNDYFKQPAAKLFLTDVQPKLYSYVVDQTPISSNIGISYAPQLPPRVLDQITSNSMKTPLYSRIDPQLVRKDGTPGQISSQPTRTDWSAEYSNFQAPPGSVNFEDIYDSRFSSYGDPYRSYSDVNLGNIQYYYSDVDALKMPNFITRSKVDFVDFRNPNGQIWPEYNRTASLDDVRSHVESQTTSDELFHREDLMSLQMDKFNRRSWQMRYAPLANGFHSGMSHGSSI